MGSVGDLVFPFRAELPPEADPSSSTPWTSNEASSEADPSPSSDPSPASSSIVSLLVPAPLSRAFFDRS